MSRVSGSRLKVLHVNKFSHVVGGVETHIQMLIAWQREHGYEIDRFSLDDVPGNGFDINSPSVKAKVQSVRTLLWSKASKEALSRKLAISRPDVLHFHNFSHYLSPSVLKPSREYGLANVVTAHDYKLVAPCYLLFRDGGFCDECAGRRIPSPAVKHRCIKDSVSKSAVCAVEHVAHRRTYLDEVDAYIAPSTTAARLLKTSDSVVPERVEVVPHGVPVKSAVIPGDQNKFQVLYMGRLAPEKGVARLIEAWAAAGLSNGWELLIAGEGSERTRLEEMSGGLPIRFLGQLSGPELEQFLNRSSVVVVPSLFPETFCLSAAEAMAKGVPVIVSDAGNLPELVSNPDLIVEGNGSQGWTTKLKWLETNHERLESLGRSCRTRIEGEYSMDRCGQGTAAVYAGAIERRLSLEG